jgi:hypothetical protein
MVSALAMALVMPVSLRATTVIAPTFDELVRAAEVVFEVKSLTAEPGRSPP